MLTLPLKLVQIYLLSLTCPETYEELPQGLHGLEYYEARFSLDQTKGMFINFRSNFSLMKCWYTSMCLVRSCWTRLLAIFRATWLSQYSNICSFGSKPISVGRVLSHNSSHIPCTIPVYSASAEDLAVMFCFLLRHVTRFPATNVK
jgi:hypothetical protein